MKNKKGFTLTEMLAVVVVLAILLGIAIPSITKYLRYGTVEYYRSIENEIKASGMDYLETYRTLLPRQIGNVAVIELKELVDNKYIEEIKDEEGNLCEGKITAKKIDSGTYEYYSCLKCGDSYSSKEEDCNYSIYDNTYVDQHLYEITVDEYNYTVNQGASFTLPLGKVYYNGELINDKLKGNPSEIDTDILGTTEVIYFYNGAKKVVTVEVIDKTKPTKPEVVLKKNNANGQTYLSSTWFSGDIYQLFKSTDYTEPGVMGSGIKKYQISTDGTNFSDLTGNTKIDTQNGSRKYYVRSVDNNNNTSNVNNYVIKIDKEIPKCELEVKSGTLGSNGWYTSNITIGFKSTTETVSSLVHSSISITSITSNTSSTTSTGTVIDEAGNIGTCSITVKLDKTVPNPPIIASNDKIGSGSWHKANTTISFSGASNISGNTYYYGTSTSPSTVGTSYTRTSETGGTTYYTKVCSGAGLCSSNSSYNMMLDKTAPGCTNSGDSTAYTGSNRTIYYGCSDSLSKCHASYSGSSKTFSSTTVTSTIAAYTIKDNAGNTTSCPARTANVYVDKTAPSCSFSKTTTYSTAGVSGTVNCSDGNSGCSSSNTTTFSNRTANTNYTIKDNVGNSTTCTLPVSPQTQYRKNTCSAFNANGPVCGYHCNNGYTLSGAYCSITTSVGASYSDCLTGSNTCVGGYLTDYNNCTQYSCVLYKSCTLCSDCPISYPLAIGGKCYKKYNSRDAVKTACGTSAWSCIYGDGSTNDTCWCTKYVKDPSCTTGRQSGCGSETVYGWDSCKNANSLKCDSYGTYWSGCASGSNTCQGGYYCSSGYTLSGTTCYTTTTVGANHNSCAAAGCATWGGWSGWSTTGCSAVANQVSCESRVVYY